MLALSINGFAEKAKQNLYCHQICLNKNLAKNVPFLGAETFIASEKSLMKDWGYKGDYVWDEL